MALNWDISKCKNLNHSDMEWQVTDVLIWATMSVGMYQITEKNYEEFYKRIHYVELLNGTWRWRGDEAVFITLEDVKKHIGLKTNAGTFSRVELIKRQTKRFFGDK